MKIELSENSNNENISLTEFPAGYVFLGKDKNEKDFKIFISQKTLNDIDSYLSSDTLNELGGVLTGDLCVNSDNERFIKINGYITAKHTNSSLSRLTFTHETWEYINDELEKNFKDKRILGWFHSHPGHTVFMSNFDTFIQENFFNMDYMVAYVFDPTIKERGFFFWEGNKTVRASGFYIYDQDGSNLLLPDYVKEENESVGKLELKPSLKSRLLKYFTFTVFSLNILLLVFMAYYVYMINQKLKIVDELSAEIGFLKNENEKLKEKLNNLIIGQELKNFNQPVYGQTSNSSDSNSELSNLNKNNLKDKRKDTVKKAGNADIMHTVKAGDTLEKIAAQYYQNPDKIGILMLKNNIKNKSDLKIGQVILIPLNY